MNCKPGDIAMVVAPYAKQGRGRIVEVLRLAGKDQYLNGRHFSVDGPGGVGWVVCGKVANALGHELDYLVIADNALRPLRDPGEQAVDESLAYLPPVPCKEVAR